MHAILAFLDEYNLEMNLPDIIELNDGEFETHFGKFIAKVGYVVMRFSLRKNRISEGMVGTLIEITPNYKIEVGELLATIRKIVNQEIKDVKKRDKIFSRIAALQSEIDRDKTTVDALSDVCLTFQG